MDNIVEGLIRCVEESEGKGETYNLSDYCTIEKFVSIISENLGKPSPRLRLPESAVKFASKIFEKIPSFPLTSSRVAALTNRVVYPTNKIEQELGYNVMLDFMLRKRRGIQNKVPIVGPENQNYWALVILIIKAPGRCILLGMLLMMTNCGGKL